MNLMKDSSINQLNDDCLHQIFTYLPIADMMNAEKVCSRWQHICEWMLDKVRKFDNKNWGCDFKPMDIFDSAERDNQCRNILQAFERCHRKLTEITLTCYPDDELELFTDAVNHVFFCCFDPSDEFLESIKNTLIDCSSLETISLCACFIWCDNNYLSTLFKKNKNLRSLQLINFDINDGSCLQNLSKDLEGLKLIDCRSSPHYLSDSQIPKFYNLREIIVTRRGPCDLILKDLCSFGSANLQKVRISNMRCYNDISRLKHLTVLSVCNTHIGNNELKSIAMNCKELSALNIGRCSLLTNAGLSQIAQLEKLKCLNMSGLNKHMELEHIGLSKTLKLLNCSKNDITDANLVVMLSSLENLEILNVCGCYKITNTFIEFVMIMIQSRKNNVSLKIFSAGSQIKLEKIVNTSPALKLINSSEVIDYDNFL